MQFKGHIVLPTAANDAGQKFVVLKTTVVKLGEIFKTRKEEQLSHTTRIILFHNIHTRFADA